MAHGFRPAASDPGDGVARKAAIIEASPAVSYALEPKGRRATFRSANALEYFGWSTSGGRSVHDCWLEAINPDDLQVAERQLDTWLAAGAEGVLHRSYRIRHGEGHELWVDDHLRAARDGCGRIVELVGIMEDSTERDGSARRLDALAGNVPGMIFQLLLRPDGTSCYPYASAGIRDVFGLEPDDVHHDSAPLFARVHPDDREKLRATLWAAAESLAPPRTHYRVRHPRKGEIWVQGRSTPRRLADGSVLFEGYLTDSTEENVAKAELERTRDELQGFFEVAIDLLCIADREGRFVKLGKAWESTLGYPLEVLIGCPFLDLVHPDDRAATVQAMACLDAGSGLHDFVNRYRCADGTYRLIEWRSQPHGSLVYAAARDVTERQGAMQALEESRRKLASLFRLAPMGIALSRLDDGRILEVNPALEAMTGFDSEFLLARTFNDLIPARSLGREAAEQQRLLEAGRYGPVERRLRRADGREATVLLHGVTVDTAEGETQVWSIVQDITEQKRSQLALKALAEQDALTGLVNRKVLTERLRALCEGPQTARGGAIVLLDLDHFKEINDTLGHDAGDTLLQEIAQRLRATVDPADLVARLGGDEFALLLHGRDGRLTHADAEATVRAVAEALREPLRLGQRTLQPRCSLGVAMLPNDGNHPSELMKHADIALYRSKALGRDNWTFFDRSMRDDVERRATIADALREAIAVGGISLALQPQQALAKQRHAGFEALVRWKHRGRLIPPGAFVPVAEETGLIVALGRTVMEKALAHLRHLLDLDLEPGRMAVNVAAAQLKEPGFTAELAELLARFRLQPAQIELEITEGVLLDRGGERIAQTLQAVHRLGVSIALDDFGTGYASLKHLNRFPVDRLKIDQSFVRDIGTDPQDAAIARAVINLAHSLGMDVVAEGVETEEQLAFLRLHRCDVAQGYLLGRPLTLDAAAAYLARSGMAVEAPPSGPAPRKPLSLRATTG